MARLKVELNVMLMPKVVNFLTVFLGPSFSLMKEKMFVILFRFVLGIKVINSLLSVTLNSYWIRLHLHKFKLL